VIQVAQLEPQDKQWERTIEYHPFSPISTALCDDMDLVAECGAFAVTRLQQKELCAKECSKIWKSCCFFF